MALNPRDDTNGTGFSPQVARRAPTIPGTGPSAASTAASRPQSPKQLIVGREIQLSGEITACDSLIVEGHIEASLRDSRSLEITETGDFKGAVEVEEAIIGGLYEGEMTVLGRLFVQSTGRVSGNIRYGSLEVEAGGILSGQIEAIDGGAAPRPMAESEPASGAAPASYPVDPEPAPEPVLSSAPLLDGGDD